MHRRHLLLPQRHGRVRTGAVRDPDRHADADTDFDCHRNGY
jgi:hypothetical protein